MPETPNVGVTKVLEYLEIPLLAMMPLDLLMKSTHRTQNSKLHYRQNFAFNFVINDSKENKFDFIFTYL